jgi:hypothetical protein
VVEKVSKLGKWIMAEIEFTFKGNPEDLQKLFGTEYRVKAMLFDQVLSQHRQTRSFPTGVDPLDVLFSPSSQPLLPPSSLPQRTFQGSREKYPESPPIPLPPVTMPGAEPNSYQDEELQTEDSALGRNLWMFILLVAIATGMLAAIATKPIPLAQKLFRLNESSVETPALPPPADPASTTTTPEPSPTPPGLIERLEQVIGEPSATPN